jgi:hypothetical protein
LSSIQKRKGMVIVDEQPESPPQSKCCSWKVRKYKSLIQKNKWYGEKYETLAISASIEEHLNFTGGYLIFLIYHTIILFIFCAHYFFQFSWYMNSAEVLE